MLGRRSPAVEYLRGAEINNSPILLVFLQLIRLEKAMSYLFYLVVKGLQNEVGLLKLNGIISIKYKRLGGALSGETIHLSSVQTLLFLLV